MVPPKIFLLISFLLATASIILSIIAWCTTTRYSLPLPLALPVINVAMPLALPALVVVTRRLTAHVKKGVSAFLLPYAWYFTSLMAVILFVLATMYGTPSDMSRCGTEAQWRRMFQRKDDAGIRAIQSGLQCCGLNSLHDRAWPFPSRKVDARACERTLGYTSRCADRWQRQEAVAAGLIALASLLNWTLLQVLSNATQSEQLSSRYPIMPGLQTEEARLLHAPDAEEDHRHGGREYHTRDNVE
ncbi:hypothetical protein PV11_01803 [Exophiala sideris]|uniref:Tetraspanin Tsp3 n=1 Tax=Exophiala sideris TaxID=1016849 RepID=A0A0D1ZH79_9EURO|nr:hypothetical protein PV11_01803 [Exophiala sideris]